MFEIVFTAGYNRTYERLPTRIQQKTDEQIQRLRTNPFHPSLRTHKRKDDPTIWQARITRSYRLFFRLEGGIITLLNVIPHEK